MRSSSDIIAFVGLSLTLVGAALLFFYGIPRKKYHHVFIGADSVQIASPAPGEVLVQASEWQKVADTFQARARRLNRAGFLFVVVGTIFQMVAILCAT